MRTLSEKYLSDVAVAKDAYEIDIAVLDRYQSFSAELLRLALLGIAGYGFLIANVIFKLPNPCGSSMYFETFPESRYVLAVGTVSLALSAVGALGHRYFSTDSLAHHVRRLRLNKRVSEMPEADPERSDLERVLVHELHSLHQDLRRCHSLLVWSCVFLVVGAACVALSFATTLFFAQ